MHARQTFYQLGYIPNALTHPCPYPLTDVGLDYFFPTPIFLHSLPVTFSSSVTFCPPLICS